MATLIHQRQTFSRIGPIGKEALLEFDDILDKEWLILEKQRVEALEKEALKRFQDRHLTDTGTAKKRRLEEIKAGLLEYSFKASRRMRVLFDSEKELIDSHFIDIINEPQIERERPYAIICDVNSNAIKISVNVRCGSRQFNEIEIDTYPINDNDAKRIFNSLRGWAQKLEVDSENVANLNGAMSCYVPISALAQLLLIIYWLSKLTKWSDAFAVCAPAGFILLLLHLYIDMILKQQYSGVYIGSGKDVLMQNARFRNRLTSNSAQNLLKFLILSASAAIIGEIAVRVLLK